MSVSQATAQFSGGAGTTHDPYLIGTPEQFDQIRNFKDKKFKLIADLDFKGYEREGGEAWWPVGEWGSGDNSPDRFSGVFDGNGYAIKNLKAERVAHDLSIFGVTEGAKIVNLVVENCEIVGEGRLGVVTGATFRSELDQIAVINSNCLNTLSDHGSNAGGITGPLFQSTITNSYVLGGIIYGKDGIGGISSVMESGSTIANCYASCSVEGTTNIGGITGRTSNGYIINSIALNSELICHDANDGRIAGIVNGNDLLSNNYAGVNVKINGVETSTDLGLNVKNGENVSDADLATELFYATKAKFAILETDPSTEDYVQIWKLDTKIAPYPVLLWQKGISSGINILKKPQGYSVISSEDNIKVNGLKGNSTVYVYTTSGILINKVTANDSAIEIPVTGNGIYIVNILSEGNSHTVKLIK
jgi:hypothetical protein